MTEGEVAKKITFPSIREAFQRCKFEEMPDPILERYAFNEEREKRGFFPKFL